MALELVEAAFDGVALFVALGVEGRGPAAPATAAGAVGFLVGGLGDGGSDSAPPQVAADRPAGVGLVTQDAAGPGAGPAAAGAADRDPAMTCSKPVESCRFPGVVTRATGRQRRSAARWILVVRPPRERPSASRAAGFVSFGPAPPQVRGRGAAGSRRVLVSADRAGVHGQRPAPALGGVTPAAELTQHHRPGPIGRPPAVPVIHRLPAAITLWEVPPRRAGPGPPQHPVDHLSVIGPPAAPARRPVRQ